MSNVILPPVASEDPPAHAQQTSGGRLTAVRSVRQLARRLVLVLAVAFTVAGALVPPAGAAAPSSVAVSRSPEHALRAASSERLEIRVLLIAVFPAQGHRATLCIAELASDLTDAGGDPVNSSDPTGEVPVGPGAPTACEGWGGSGPACNAGSYGSGFCLLGHNRGGGCNGKDLLVHAWHHTYNAIRCLREACWASRKGAAGVWAGINGAYGVKGSGPYSCPDSDAYDLGGFFAFAPLGALAPEASGGAAIDELYLDGLPAAAEDAGAASGASKALEPLWAQAPNNGFLGGWSTTETLQPGLVIDRYGAETGRFFSPEGTSFEARSLPAGSGPYNAYEVIKAFDVQGGIAAPAFGEPGLGVQYMASQNVADLIEGGFIKPVGP